MAEQFEMKPYLKFDDDITKEERAKIKWLAMERCKTKGHLIGRINKEILICWHGPNYKDEMRAPKTFTSLQDPELDAHIVSTC